jgi:hypothetical protein
MDALWPYVAALGYPAIMLAVLYLVVRVRADRDARTADEES